MAIEDKYLKESNINGGNEVYIGDSKILVKKIDYDEARNCANCMFSSGPKDEMECKAQGVRRMYAVSGTSTAIFLTFPHMVCNYWRKS
jgi:hypothetical protein